ncbi:hypothetical protein BDV06DRAFT_204580 [Aspergillus oleicola]
MANGRGEARWRLVPGLAMTAVDLSTCAGCVISSCGTNGKPRKSNATFDQNGDDTVEEDDGD